LRFRILRKCNLHKSILALSSYEKEEICSQKTFRRNYRCILQRLYSRCLFIRWVDSSSPIKVEATGRRFRTAKLLPENKVRRLKVDTAPYFNPKNGKK
jgi:hypothetical protein